MRDMSLAQRLGYKGRAELHASLTITQVREWERFYLETDGRPDAPQHALAQIGALVAGLGGCEQFDKRAVAPTFPVSAEKGEELSDADKTLASMQAMNVRSDL